MSALNPALEIKLGMEASGVQKGLGMVRGELNQTDAAVEKTGGMFGKLKGFMANLFAMGGGTAGGVFAGMLGADVVEKGVETIKDQFHEAIGEAERLQQTQMQTNAIFGAGSKEVREWAEGAATSLGLTNDQAQETADTFGALFKNVGFANDQLPEMAKGMTDVVANVAAFKDVDPAGVTKAFQSALAGNMRGLKQYGILITNADIAQEALRETGKKSTKDLTNQELVQARYNVILDKTKGMMTAVKDRTNTLAGAERILHAELGNLREEIGLKLIPVLALMTIGAAKLLPILIKIVAFAIHPLIVGFGKLIGLLRPVIAAIGMLAGVIKTAWQGGKSFSDQISTLPGPLRALGLGLVEIVHGVELLRRAFDKDGLRGVLDALPHSLDLLGAGLKGLGGVIAGFAESVFSGLVDALGQVDWGSVASTAWALLKDAVVGVAKAGLALGSVVVNIAGWAWGKIADLGDWIAHHAFGSSQGDATGGAFGPGFGNVIQGVTIPQATVNVLDWAWGTVKDLAKWTKDNIGTVWDGIVDAGTWTLSIGVPAVAFAAGVSADSIKTAIHDKIAPMTVDLGDWSLTIGLPKISFAAGFGLGALARGMYETIKTAVVDWSGWKLILGAPLVQLGFIFAPFVAAYLAAKMGPVNLLKWTLNLGAQFVVGFVEGAHLEGTIEKAIEALNIVVNLEQWTLNLGKPLIPSLGSFAGLVNLSIWIAESLPGVKPLVMLANWTLHVGKPDLPDISFANLALWVADAVVLAATLGAVGVNADGFKWNISIPKPDLPDISAKSIGLWLADAVAEAVTLGAISVDGSGIHWNLSVPIPHISIGGGGDSSKQSTSDAGGGGGGGFGGLIGDKSGIGSLKIPAPDTSAFDTSLKGIGDKLAAFTKTAYVATFDINDSPAAIKYTDAETWGSIWAKGNFVSTFDINDGPAAIKFTDAEGWGGLWASQTFVSTFAADNGPAAVAYTDAFGWGDIWANQVFTATFSIDTSPLYDALNTVWLISQEISDLLPHSPAKKGPLSKPISFGHIHEALARDLAGMPETAASAMGGVQDALARSVSIAARPERSARRAHAPAQVVVKVERAYGIADLTEQVVRVATPALAGALRKRRVNLGVTS